MNRITTRKDGFTLVETFVAITILLIAVAGPLGMAANALNATLVAQDKLTATYLAQEAIEYIRSVRDGNFLSRSNWLSGLGNCTTGAPCKIDVWNAATPIVQCSANPCTENFYYNGTLHRYDYVTSGQATTFKRSVWIEGSGAEERTIRVRVEWNSGGRLQSLELTSPLTSWAAGLI